VGKKPKKTSLSQFIYPYAASCPVNLDTSQTLVNTHKSVIVVIAPPPFGGRYVSCISALIIYNSTLLRLTGLAQIPYKSTETVQKTGIAPNPLSPVLSIFSSINLCDSVLSAAAVWVNAPYLRADVAPLFRQLQPLVNDGQPTIYRE